MVDPASPQTVLSRHQYFKIGSFVKRLLNNLTINGQAQLIQKLMQAPSLCPVSVTVLSNSCAEFEHFISKLMHRCGLMADQVTLLFVISSDIN